MSIFYGVSIQKFILHIKQQVWSNSFFDVVNFFHSSELEYVLDGGNLLSIVRDDNLFPHYKDGDIDFALIWNENSYEKVLKDISILSEKGYIIKIGYFSIEIKKNKFKFFKKIPLLSRIANLFSPVINVSLFRRCDGYVWTTWLNKGGKVYLPRVIPEKYFLQVRTIEFRGSVIKAPLHLESYLSQKYGAGWRETNKNWVYYENDGFILLDWANSDCYQNW